MIQEINWLSPSEYKELSNKEINEVENKMKVAFPSDYKEVVKKYQGCVPLDKNVVEIGGFKESFNFLLTIESDEYIGILEVYDSIKDRLVKNVIPFANDPGGNFYCFDYRNSSEPKIVFWDHEEAYTNPEKALIYVCENFTELINGLRPLKEDEE
ncbi:SMI1/KNR4 family protein [Bacillus paralicheniformis]|uniref:SMI1/KNR4 family protein n=1 Tax=Bacillus paralicheniformis TaxID=1648923 RepID=UPI00128DFF2C|nr:SMI1/KNR4 family protein [Bacillus paralicheniformis]